MLKIVKTYGCFFLIFSLFILSSCAGRYSYLISVDAPQGLISIPVRTDESIGLEKPGDKMNATVELISVRDEE